MFGEEGVRQVAKLTSLVGDDLRPVMAEISEMQVMSDDDVENAIEMKQAVQEINAQFQALSAELGKSIIPLMTDLVGLVEQTRLPAILETWVSKITQVTDGFTAAKDALHALTTEDVHGTVDANMASAADHAADLAQFTIATGREMAGIAAKQEEAAKIDQARAGLAVSRLTTYEDIYQTTLDTAAAYADIIGKVKEWESSVDEVQLALEEAMTPLEDGTAAAEAFGGALDEVGRTKGLDTLEQFGDTEQAISDMFGVIKENKGVIPDIFDTGNARSRDFRDSLEQLATSYKENLQQVITDTGGNFDEVRKRARELRQDLRERISMRLGVDLTRHRRGTPTGQLDGQRGDRHRRRDLARRQAGREGPDEAEGGAGRSRPSSRCCRAPPSSCRLIWPKGRSPRRRRSPPPRRSSTRTGSRSTWG